MSDMSKYRADECSPSSSRIGVGHGVNDPAVEKLTVTEPPEPMEEAKARTGF
jgi:hypothetical protein